MSNGSLLEGGGHLFNIFSLGGANSKQGAYLKLGANSSIYSMCLQAYAYNCLTSRYELTYCFPINLLKSGTFYRQTG